MTLAVAVPLPFTTVQVCGGLAGGVKTETLKFLPLTIAVLKAKGPFPVTVRLSPELFCKTIPVLPELNPVTTPPIMKGPALEPGPEPVVFLKLQPTRSTEVIAMTARR
jgi:hypothetical protein